MAAAGQAASSSVDLKKDVDSLKRLQEENAARLQALEGRAPAPARFAMSDLSSHKSFLVFFRAWCESVKARRTPQG